MSLLFCKKLPWETTTFVCVRICVCTCANCWRVHICVVSEGVHVVRLMEAEVRGQGWRSLPAASESCSRFLLFSPLASCPSPPPLLLPGRRSEAGGRADVHGRRPRDPDRCVHADAEDQSFRSCVARWPLAGSLVFCPVSLELFSQVGVIEVLFFFGGDDWETTLKGVFAVFYFFNFFLFLDPGLRRSSLKKYQSLLLTGNCFLLQYIWNISITLVLPWCSDEVMIY